MRPRNIRRGCERCLGLARLTPDVDPARLARAQHKRARFRATLDLYLCDTCYPLAQGEFAQAAQHKAAS
jgi:hypothetical protein